MNKQQPVNLAATAGIDQITATLQRLYPGATTDLIYENPFQLLIAVMLSAQSTDKQVNKVTARLFARYRTPEEIARLTPEELAPLIQGCGLYRNKSKHIIETCRTLVEKHGGQVPSSREELEKLPGVGRKTASVVLMAAFGQATLPVDTHVFRLARRLGLAAGRTPRVVEEQLLAIVPPGQRRFFHHALIKHGRAVCLARRPRCAACDLRGCCRYYQEKGLNIPGMSVV
ncbi:MAG: endonuclease III [Desulfurispora sp.]|uniref:endonuclease III n=1 Tax=Desulfurispora sp. TaxID=3014275 RepID=UPI00404A2C65